MGTKRIKLETAEQVLDLYGMGVKMWFTHDAATPSLVPAVVGSYLVQRVLRVWDMDHNRGWYYYIEVEDDEEG